MSWYDPTSWDLSDYSWHGAHNWFVGGDATKGINMKLGGYDQAQAGLGQLGQSQAPQVYGQQLNPYQMDQSRGGMMDTANRLGGIASGQQQGAGEMAVNAQVGRANAAQNSAARMSRGANAALAYRNAMRNQADIGLAGAGQAGQARMQDQAQANAQLGQMYGQMYGQDAAVAGQNAALGQQAQLANQQAALQNRALQIQAYGQQLGWSQAQIDEELKKAGIEAADKGILASAFSGVGGAMAAKSDERLKTDIRDGGADADDFMAQLGSKVYRYKDPRDGEGHRLGIMAQDLERSKMGRETVVRVDDQGHLGFDIGKAASAALASVARLHERLSKVEGREPSRRLGEAA